MKRGIDIIFDLDGVEGICIVLIEFDKRESNVYRVEKEYLKFRGVDYIDDFKN